jgi:aryl-alcohol dehydrogenase-like predicted oxidoreductase
VAAQQQFNVFGGNQQTLELCQRLGLASLCRSPLAMGLLTGKYWPGQRLGADDVRAATPYWDYFKPGRMEAWRSPWSAPLAGQGDGRPQASIRDRPVKHHPSRHREPARASHTQG